MTARVRSIWFKVLCVAIGLILLYLFAEFLFPILLAVALSFVLYPLTKLFERIPVGKGGIPKVIAILLSFVVLASFLYVAVDLLIMPTFSEANRLLHNLPQLTDVSGGLSLKALLGSQKTMELPNNIVSLMDKALSMATAYLLEGLQSVVTSTLDIASGIVGLMVVPFLSFYFLKDWEALRDMLIDIFPYDEQEKVKDLLYKVGVCIGVYVTGMVKLCILMATLITIGAYAIGLKYPLVLGFVAFIAEAVPIIGPTISSVPAVFLAYSQDPMLAVKAAVFYFLVYQLDSQYVMPNIMGRSLSLHPVVIILSVIIGGKIFGMTGLLFAVPVAAVFRVLYQELWHQGEGETRVEG